MGREDTEPVIAVSGSPGSGKTTYARHLSNELGLRFISGGMVFRELAREKGLSLIELNRLASIDPRIDIELERRLFKEALKGGSVIESHLAGWTLRGVADVLIYIKADLSTRVKRISKRENKEIDEVIIETAWREAIEAQRFYSLYAIDLTDLSHFDIVLDTTYLTEEEAKEILLFLTKSILRKKLEAKRAKDPSLIAGREGQRKPSIQ